MGRISLILFDMNDVLYRYNKAARIACLARVSGKEASAVEAAIWGSGYEDLGDAGAMDAKDYLLGFGKQLGYDLTLDEWMASLRASIRPLPDALALAQQIRRKTRTAVLTNNNLLVRQHSGILFPELRRAFGAALYVSAEFRAQKPDPVVYSRCVDALGVPAAETLFIDDSGANVAGAERAGLQAHRHTTVKVLADALERSGLL